MGLETDEFASFDWFGKPLLPHIELWSAAEGRTLGDAGYEGQAGSGNARHLCRPTATSVSRAQGDLGSIDTIGFDGTRERLGSPSFGFTTTRDWFRRTDLERRTGRWLGAVEDDNVLVIDIGEHSIPEPRRLGRHEDPVRDVLFDPLGRFFATIAEDGRMRLWDNADISPPILLDGPPGANLDITADGSLLEASTVEDDEINPGYDRLTPIRLDCCARLR